MIKETQDDKKIYIQTICPYCGISFKNNTSFYSSICQDEYGYHSIITVCCTHCEKPIVIEKSLLTISETKDKLDKTFVKNVENYYGRKINNDVGLAGLGGFAQMDILEKYKLIKPTMHYRNPIPKEVTDSDIIKDYYEACLTIETSIRASAALSRRCLQSILEKNNPNLKPTQLNKQIDEVINAQDLPSSITDLLHAVREIGNISVHPIKDVNSGIIIETSQEEAEMNLEVIEALFDYYYVMPAKNAERKNRLNQKLAQAGRKTV